MDRLRAPLLEMPIGLLKNVGSVDTKEIDRLCAKNIWFWSNTVGNVSKSL